MKSFCLATAMSFFQVTAYAMEILDPDRPYPTIKDRKIMRGLTCTGCQFILTDSLKSLPEMQIFEDALGLNGWVQKKGELIDGVLLGRCGYHNKDCPDSLQNCRINSKDFLKDNLLSKRIVDLIESKKLKIEFVLPFNNEIDATTFNLFSENQRYLNIYDNEEVLLEKFKVSFGVSMGKMKGFRTNNQAHELTQFFRDNYRRYNEDDEIENLGFEGSFNMIMRDEEDRIRAVGSLHILPNYLAGKMIAYDREKFTYQKGKKKKEYTNMPLMISLQMILTRILGKKFLSSGPYSKSCEALKYKFSLPGAEIIRFDEEKKIKGYSPCIQEKKK